MPLLRPVVVRSVVLRSVVLRSVVVHPVVVHRVVVPVVAAACAIGCAAGVTGCSSLAAALSHQQAIVSFKDGTSTAVLLRVRAACGKLPNVSPAPLPTTGPQAKNPVDVVYNIDKASPADEARLQQCLAKFPSVQGMDIEDSTDMGS